MMRKRAVLWGLAGLALSVFVVSAVVLARVWQADVDRLSVGGTKYDLEVVATSGAQQKGLSGRSSLPRDTGMLFEFDAMGERCFWMKDMRFSIGIIWADAAKRVTRIEDGLSPKTYPRSYCAQARYVIELNAGEAAKNGLKVGDALDF